MDDWMRDILQSIRAAKARTRAAQPTGPRSEKCAHPGCSALVQIDSRTGVCRNHMHKEGCRCNQCKRCRNG